MSPGTESQRAALFLLYRKDRRRRSFELKMPAGRRATQIDDLGIKKDKNLPHQILHQDRHHLENNPYPVGLPAHMANVRGSKSFWRIIHVFFTQRLNICFHCNALL